MSADSQRAPGLSRRAALQVTAGTGLALAAAATSSVGERAQAQTTTQQVSATRQTITTEAARAMIAAAETKARDVGVPMTIAVVDESGTLKAFSRMDGAILLSVGIAQDKAFTAVGIGAPTHDVFNLIKDDPSLLHGLPNVPRVIVFGGGYPVTRGNAVIGGIGVSGGSYTVDMEVAQAGLAALR